MGVKPKKLAETFIEVAKAYDAEHKLPAHKALEMRLRECGYRESRTFHPGWDDGSHIYDWALHREAEIYEEAFKVLESTENGGTIRKRDYGYWNDVLSNCGEVIQVQGSKGDLKSFCTRLRAFHGELGRFQPKLAADGLAMLTQKVDEVAEGDIDWEQKFGVTPEYGPRNRLMGYQNVWGLH